MSRKAARSKLFKEDLIIKMRIQIVPFLNLFIRNKLVYNLRSTKKKINSNNTLILFNRKKAVIVFTSIKQEAQA